MAFFQRMPDQSGRSRLLQMISSARTMKLNGAHHGMLQKLLYIIHACRLILYAVDVDDRSV
jgi:hypothetical protein